MLEMLYERMKMVHPLTDRSRALSLRPDETRARYLVECARRSNVVHDVARRVRDGARLVVLLSRLSSRFGWENLTTA
jgi:hypothetical protein